MGAQNAFQHDAIPSLPSLAIGESQCTTFFCRPSPESGWQSTVQLAPVDLRKPFAGGTRAVFRAFCYTFRVSPSAPIPGQPPCSSSWTGTSCDRGTRLGNDVRCRVAGAYGQKEHMEYLDLHVAIVMNQIR